MTSLFPLVLIASSYDGGCNVSLEKVLIPSFSYDGAEVETTISETSCSSDCSYLCSTRADLRLTDDLISMHPLWFSDTLQCMCIDLVGSTRECLDGVMEFEEDLGREPFMDSFRVCANLGVTDTLYIMKCVGGR